MKKSNQSRIKGLAPAGGIAMRAAVFMLTSAVVVLGGGELRAQSDFDECVSGYSYPVVALSEGLELKGATRSFGRTTFLQVFDAVTSDTGRSLIEVNLEDGERASLPRNQIAFFESSGNGDCFLEFVTMDDVGLTEEDRGNLLRAKAIASVTVESVLIDQTLGQVEGGSIRSIKLRTGPNDEARVTSEISLFTIVYINAIYRDPVTENFWYFVGTSPDNSFSVNSDNEVGRNTRRGLGGWVRREDLFFWPQRQAIYPSSGMQNRLSVYADETGRNELVRLNYVDDAAPDRFNAMGKMPLRRSQNGMFQVVVPINRFSNGAVSAGISNQRDGVGGAESNDLRYNLGRLLSGSGKMDLLFVMDNSESMEVYRRSVLDGIRDAVSQNEFGDRINLSFAMFGDGFNSTNEARAWGRSGPREGFEPNWSRTMPVNARFQFSIMDFGWRGDIPTAEDLEAYFGGTYSDPQRDKPEIGIAALRTAIDVASWDADPDTIRFVFYIGDDISRIAPSPTLAAEIKAKGISVVPINVAGNAVDKFNEGWLAQMNLLRILTDNLSGRGGVYDSQIAYAVDGSNSARLTKSRVTDIIAGVLGFIEGFQGDRGQIIETVRSVENDLTGRNIPGGSFSDQTFRNILGGAPEELIELLSSTEIVSLGYFPEENAAIYVALSRLEHSAISGAIERACIAMADSARIRTSLEGMAESLAESFLGEARQAYAAGEGETIPEFFQRITLLPVEYFSIFGDRSISEFYTWARDDANEEELLEIQKELCLSNRLFRDVSDSVYVTRDSYDFVEYNERLEAPTFRPNRELKQEFDWLWGNETQQRFYFIPKDFFPSGTRG